jgi:RecA/RadA recombinase
MKKGGTCGGQVVVYNKQKDEVDNTGVSDSSNDDSYKQTPLNGRHSITATNSAKVANKKMKIIKLQQQEQQLITIAPSTAPVYVPLMASAAELLEQRNNSSNHLRISTGSKRLDDLLGGGIERGAVTEIVGSSRTGKTQLCLTLSVTAQQQEQKLQKANIGGKCETTPSTRVLFIDTKNTFDKRRIRSIAQLRGLDPDHAVESITIETIQNFQALEEFISEKLEESLKKNPDTVLMIVDSIIALQPTQIKGMKNENLSLWQQSLDSYLYSLRRIASQYNIAAVITNPADETAIACPPREKRIQIGKDITPHASTHTLSFQNKEQCKVARIVYSPCQPEGEVLFTINGEGITDVQP